MQRTFLKKELNVIPFSETSFGRASERTFFRNAFCVAPSQGKGLGGALSGRAPAGSLGGAAAELRQGALAGLRRGLRRGYGGRSSGGGCGGRGCGGGCGGGGCGRGLRVGRCLPSRSHATCPARPRRPSKSHAACPVWPPRPPRPPRRQSAWYRFSRTAALAKM